jgi:predicted O-methyltransferase YrrM
VLGFHLLRRHYDQPIPEKAELDNAFWQRRSELVGLEMNDRYALDLLQNVFPLYLGEFGEAFPLHRSSPDQTQFYLINSSFMAIDAHVYYIFIRHFRPKRIVEIGAGNSTLLAAAACRQNLNKNGEAPTLISVEPFPSKTLKKGLPGLSKLIQDKVQKADLELFTSLAAGDILFIDSSHVLRSGGDVQQEYCEILPRLAPGVLVHIHDISLPKPYPRVYFENRLYFNEQYLLQAFLCFNSRFEVIWPGNYMMLKYPEEVCNVFPEYHEMRKSFPMSEPSSFWMRVKS